VNVTVEINPQVVVEVERIGPDRFIVKCQKKEQVVEEIKEGDTLTITIPLEIRA